MRGRGFALAAALLAAVPSVRAAEPADAPARPLKVVATVFPVWDWTREVVGTNAPGVEIELLAAGGEDMHSYRPTASDLRKIAACDLFVHVGGPSDAWVGPALAAAPNPRRRVLDLAAVPEEGAAESGHRHGEGAAECGPDEHVWLSLRRARTLVGAIADALAAVAPPRAEAYRANAAAYREELAALDADYAAAVAAAPRRTLVVADRFPLRPLAEDYGLEWAAAFSGCSAEAEAGFRTVVGLAAKIDELGARCILVLEGPDRRLAETVRAATKTKDQAIAVFDSLQSVTAARAAAGETYLGAMRRNLAALAEALE